jgi:Uncharacterized conserved protein
MKKNVIWIVIIAVLAVAVIWGIGAYNKMVTREESVQTAWSQVENVYQRRADLIPNLVSTVKGYAEHESNTLEAVIKARAKATSATIDANNMTDEQMQAFQDAQNQLSSSLSRLLISVEKYPDLKANQNFLELQSQLEGTENRITVERKKFNEEVKAYNMSIRRFPSSIIANMFGFEKKPYFEATTEGAEKAPKVEF